MPCNQYNSTAAVIAELSNGPVTTMNDYRSLQECCCDPGTESSLACCNVVCCRTLCLWIKSGPVWSTPQEVMNRYSGTLLRQQDMTQGPSSYIFFTVWIITDIQFVNLDYDQYSFLWPPYTILMYCICQNNSEFYGSNILLFAIFTIMCISVHTSETCWWGDDRVNG